VNVAVQGDHGAVLLMATMASVHSGRPPGGEERGAHRVP